MFWLGIGAVIAAILVFCGSIWLVMSMYVGRRLAYFIVASVTLGVLVILSFVWSFVPLGPVGTLPTWKPVGVGAEASQTGFAPAARYPEPPWYTPPEDDQEAQDQAGALSTPATDALTAAIGSGKIKTFAVAGDATADAESVRFLNRKGTLYGAIRFEPVKPGASGRAVVVMRWDPGDPLGMARLICLGAGLLFALHLAGLYSMERGAARAAGKDLL